MSSFVGHGWHIPTELGHLTCAMQLQTPHNFNSQPTQNALAHPHPRFRLPSFSLFVGTSLGLMVQPDSTSKVGEGSNRACSSPAARRGLALRRGRGGGSRGG